MFLEIWPIGFAIGLEMECVYGREESVMIKAFWPQHLKNVWPFTEMGLTEGGTNFALNV